MIPLSPQSVYKYQGWDGWDNFLGTGNNPPYRGKYLPFEEARKFVRFLKLKSSREWRQSCKSGKIPNNIPSSVNKIYKDQGWIDWYDWLGKMK